MRVKITSWGLATMGATVASRKLNLTIRTSRGGSSAPVVAKQIYRALNKNASTKRVAPKTMSGTGFWQGYLLNFIQNDGKIVFPIKQLFMKNAPEVEVPDWVALCTPSASVRRKAAKSKGYSKQRAKELYSSDEWRKLRYEVLREQGGRCQLCGRGREHCVILHVDHIIPLSVDWSKRLDKNNLQVLCEDCNLGKSNTDTIDWR